MPDDVLVRHRLGPSRLYLDDVQLIYESLVRAACERVSNDEGIEAAPVVITAGDSVAESGPDDLRDATPRELQDVQLSLARPLVSITLSRQWAGATAQASDNEGMKVARGIQAYINKRKTRAGIKICKHAGDAFLMITVVAVCEAGVATLSYLKHTPYAGAVSLGSAGLLSLLAILGRAYFLIRSGTVNVIARRRRELRGLNSNMRQQLIIGLVCAVAGALIAGVAGLWAGAFHR